MADLIQITYEAKQLAAQVNDLAGIARHLNAVHGSSFQPRDIEKLLADKTPGASIPRNYPGVMVKVGEPIGWQPAISTNRGGVDPLAVATNAYIEKNRAKIEALAR